jgi:hypothetical protein
MSGSPSALPTTLGRAGLAPGMGDGGRVVSPARAVPFVCAGFAVVARQRRHSRAAAGWLVRTRDLDWDDLFPTPSRAEEYSEAAFRRIAALNGWRLTQIVPVGERERWLYFEKAR